MYIYSVLPSGGVQLACADLLIRKGANIDQQVLILTMTSRKFIMYMYMYTGFPTKHATFNCSKRHAS